MTKKLSLSISLFVGAVGLLLVGVLMLRGISSRLALNPRDTAVPKNALPEATTTASSGPCSADVSGLNDVAPLPSEFQWSTGASTTLSDTFTIDSYRDGPTLTGEMWETTSTETDEKFLQRVLGGYSNYYQELEQHGWQIQTSLIGHKIVGIEADGPNYGSDYGLMKVQNDRVRAIVLRMGRRRGVTAFSVFLSDIVPIAGVIPDYKSNCDR